MAKGILMMTKTPQKLLDAVSGASAQAKAERVEAREAVVPAIRALEIELRNQLGDASLRGLKNLGFGAGPYFYAARVRGKPDTKLLWPHEDDDVAETLVLVPAGRLRMAICRTDEHGELDLLVTERDVHDDELRAEDLQELLGTLAVVIPRHVANAEKASERYAGLRELSENVLKLLDPPSGE